MFGGNIMKHNFPTMITPYKPDGSLDLETAKKTVLKVVAEALGEDFE